MERMRFIRELGRGLACGVLCLLFNTLLLPAQRVYYCAPTADRSIIRQEFLGKAGSFYWVQTVRNRRALRHSTYPRVTEEESFTIYDERMSIYNEILSFPYSNKTQKEYFVTGENYFDQVLLLGGEKKTSVFLHRYEPDGQPMDAGRVIAVFPFEESGYNFLMIRSQDRERVLVLGFESVSQAAPRLHALLFDRDWQLLSSKVYVNASFSQPIIQDDFSGFPLEDFDRGAVKLANNGQWLMAIPTRLDSNYLLCHFDAADTGVSYRKMRLPASAAMEDVDVMVDNERGTASAAVLSDYHNLILKNVTVFHYSMSSKVIDFDTSYRFNTLVSGKLKDDGLVKENFIAVPGKGFILLKEYGRSFTDLYGNEWGGESSIGDDQRWDPMAYFSGPDAPDKGVKSPVLRDGYARYNNLGALGNAHARGDLNFFYFPSTGRDSCWSALISQEQVTEMNTPNLSYFVVPVKDRLYFLYNVLLRGQNLYASTSVIDPQGNLHSDEGVLFWGFRNALRFQQSRQLSDNEVVIPYAGGYGRDGFAVVRF
jgi:hypothetical protein